MAPLFPCSLIHWTTVFCIGTSLNYPLSPFSAVLSTYQHPRNATRVGVNQEQCSLKNIPGWTGSVNCDIYFPTPTPLLLQMFGLPSPKIKCDILYSDLHFPLKVSKRYNFTQRPMLRFCKGPSLLSWPFFGPSGDTTMVSNSNLGKSIEIRKNKYWEKSFWL